MIQNLTSIPEPVTQELLFKGQLSRNTFAHSNHSLSIQDEDAQHYVKKKQITYNALSPYNRYCYHVKLSVN